ncbi:Y-family DNA polymerase [Microbulbifer sp. ANSA002]|uniref:Y-family DNA polymerase n=1 Tax=unclassified Microbulbifer TaxID=2619833 RepID=UPI004041ECFC
MLWLCIRFSKLPLEALTRAQTPEERSQPLAIVENQIIVEANKAAFKSGIISGLNSATAQNLCPDLKLLQRNREKEQRHREELALWAFSFSPKVSISAEDHKEGSHSSYLYIELGSGLKTNDGLRVLLDTMQQELAQMSISHKLGLGHSPSAALLLSKLPEHQQWLQQTHTPPTLTQWKQWISIAPCKLLESDNKTIEQLYFHGFKKVGQLLTTPLSEVETLFGRAFIDHLTRLNGNRHRSTTYNRPSIQFENSIYFSTPVKTKQQLKLACTMFFGQFSIRIKYHRAYTKQLHWQLINDIDEIKHSTVDLSSSQTEMQITHFLDALDFNKVFFYQKTRIPRLTCTNLPLNTREIFDLNISEGIFRSRENNKHKLIDKLIMRLGPHTCSQIKQNTHFSLTKKTSHPQDEPQTPFKQ